MKQPNLSLPISAELDRAIKRDAKDEQLSRAALIRRILSRYYGLLARKNGTP
jgi:hypothetical protein